MVCTVVYVVSSAHCIKLLCGELANLIVANKAYEYRIGVIAVYGLECNYIAQPQKITTHFVSNVRRQLHEIYDKIEVEATTEDDIRLVLTRVLLENNTDMRKVTLYSVVHNKFIAMSPNFLHSGIIGHGRAEEPPLKSIKLTRIYQGNFTIGNIEAPLLSVPVSFYPLTRRSTTIDVANYIEGTRVVLSSQLKTESGATINPEHVEKAYVYLNELVVVDKGIKELMDGEFEGAQRWNKAFELLATVPLIAPWIQLEHTDVVVGDSKAAAQFLRCFGTALKEKEMCAIARLCRDPKRENGTLKHKGKLELVVLKSGKNGQLLSSPLPFREDYKYYYKFSDVYEDVSSTDLNLEKKMDNLVRLMKCDTPPEPRRNPLNERVARYVRDFIADGEATIPPPPKPLAKHNPVTKALSEELMTEYGIVERSNDQTGAHGTNDQNQILKWDFELE